jgi:glycosyltransferase involved in cell wall biosynthesis
LIHYQDKKHQPFYEIDPQVDLVSLGFSKHDKSNRSWLFRKILYLRHSLRLRSYIKKEKVGVVVSFMDAVNVHSIFSMLFSSIPVIACERNDPSYHHVSKLVGSFRRNLYPRAALVTTQTKKAANYFPDMIRARTFLVKNPVQISKFSHLIDNWSMSNKSILAIGRLERQKGFDILINAFAQLAKEHEDWTLTILGEGKEFGALQTQVDKLNLGDRISIAGIVKDIRPHLEKASIFALSSRYEGFPNVLLEAMAAGRPIVATNCPSGVSELLNDGESGLLVSNEATEELAAGLTSLISDHGLAEKYRQNGIKTIQNYDESIVLDSWEQLVKHVIK